MSVKSPLSILFSTLFLISFSKAGTTNYSIPLNVPNGAITIDPAPVGLSLEFFAFPSYFTNVTGTHQCLQNLEALTQKWPPLRIGGTTQDRATYDESSSAYVVYSVSQPTDAPSTLTFGPAFIELAATYNGTMVLGLNRGHNNITNTIAAARKAESSMTNLLAIELGNEPEYWSGNQPQPIAANGWSPLIDAKSQDDWDIRVGEALGEKIFIQAGNSNEAPPTWGAAELIATENSTVIQYVKDYAHHNYPGGSVSSLMEHSSVSSNLAIFEADIQAATNVSRPYVLGETNSVAGGGAADVSPTFGAALWTMDYALRATSINITRIYFHHGTIGACSYCFWGRYDMGAPYYGAYIATAALAQGAYISTLDTGDTNYAVYVIYGQDGKPLRALLYNSDYYAGDGTRGNETFALNNLRSSITNVKAKRLTAESALSRVDRGQNPTFGGQVFDNVTCKIDGTETYETTPVTGGSAQFTLAASEALLVYF